MNPQEDHGVGSMMGRITLQQWISPAVLGPLESQRRAAAAAFYKLVVGLSAIAWGINGYVAFRKWDELSFDQLVAMTFGALFVTMMAAALGLLFYRNYRAGFKKYVVPSLVQRVDPGLKYYQDQGVDEVDFKASVIFHSEGRIASYVSEDLIAGTVQGVNLKMSDVYAQAKRNVRDNKGRASTKRETIFKGVLMVVEAASDLSGPLVILPRRLVDKSPIHPRAVLKRGTCGDQAFDNVFYTYGVTGPTVRAHEVPPRLRRTLMILHGAKSGNVRFAFDDNRAYVAFGSRKDTLEPPYFTPLEVFDCGAIVKDLKLLVSAAVELAANLRAERQAG